MGDIIVDISKLYSFPIEWIANNNRKHESSIESHVRASNFHYFHLYMKIWYYCGIIPFNLKLDAKTGLYQLTKLAKIEKVYTNPFRGS